MKNDNIQKFRSQTLVGKSAINIVNAKIKKKKNADISATFDPMFSLEINFGLNINYCTRFLQFQMISRSVQVCQRFFHTVLPSSQQHLNHVLVNIYVAVLDVKLVCFFFAQIVYQSLSVFNVEIPASHGKILQYFHADCNSLLDSDHTGNKNKLININKWHKNITKREYDKQTRYCFIHFNHSTI